MFFDDDAYAKIENLIIIIGPIVVIINMNLLFYLWLYLTFSNERDFISDKDGSASALNVY